MNRSFEQCIQWLLERGGGLEIKMTTPTAAIVECHVTDRFRNVFAKQHFITGQFGTPELLQLANTSISEIEDSGRIWGPETRQGEIVRLPNQNL